MQWRNIQSKHKHVVSQGVKANRLNLAQTAMQFAASFRGMQAVHCYNLQNKHTRYNLLFVTFQQVTKASVWHKSVLGKYT